jgi:Spy/CpxP family protein refolding chaperone
VTVPTSGCSGWRVLAAAALSCATLTPVAPAAQAQGRAAQQQGAAATAQAGVSPAEVQQMFDAYALVQAQQALKLRDDQYPKFLTRLRALQTVRRRSENQRLRVINELRLMTQAPDGPIDEAAIKDRLKTLSDLSASLATELRQAQNDLDEVLDVRQQARFRVFEEEIERRKVELVVRARQARRQGNEP